MSTTLPRVVAVQGWEVIDYGGERETARHRKGTVMLSRTPAPDQMGLWETLAAPDPVGVEDMAGMEQPSMFTALVQSTSEHPFEACDECGLDLAQLHHEECGGCYCDGDPCTGDDEDEE
jgi:hypothetical protein